MPMISKIAVKPCFVPNAANGFHRHPKPSKTVRKEPLSQPTRHTRHHMHGGEAKKSRRGLFMRIIKPSMIIKKEASQTPLIPKMKSILTL